MKVVDLKIIGSWADVKSAARTTVGLYGPGKAPTLEWKKQMLLAEHSPIRKMMVSWKWVDLPYWVSVHFVRHKIGIEHFVSTQRTDRTGEDRSSKSQDALVTHECLANVQAMISISRKRLCACASQETMDAWLMVILELERIDASLGPFVPECIYRGFCPEPNSCHFSNTEDYMELLKQYRG